MASVTLDGQTVSSIPAPVPLLFGAARGAPPTSMVLFGWWVFNTPVPDPGSCVEDDDDNDEEDDEGCLLLRLILSVVARGAIFSN